jgi:AraC family transcriptional regulator of adaptative response / DNA-3-methyladenine glycosylase II
VGEKEALTLELDYHPPLAWLVSLKFLADRAIPGVESVESNRYSRAVVIGESQGWINVEPAEREPALRVEISPSLVNSLPALRARIRNLFDLDAQPQLIEAQLSRDSRLSQIVKRQSGLRLPGAFDGFEMAVRAVLGQQISVRAARTLAGRMTESFGDPIETPNPNLTRLPVNAKRLAQAAAADLTGLGLTRSRAECLLALARAVAAGDLELEPGVDVESTIERLKQLPGIGDWTAQYIAMRALRWPDAFPYSDLGLRKALGETSSKRILEIAESWRPWRAYALMHLWNSLSQTLSGGVGGERGEE